MKRILVLALAAAALFAASSCQKEARVNGEANVSIKVGLPMTKAVIGDGTTAKKLIYEVYHVDNTADPQVYTLVTEGNTELKGLQASLSFTLMRNSSYVALFWAQSETAPYVTTDLRAVAMNYTGDSTVPNGNNESRDAFCASVPFDVNNDVTMDCTLKRPFSQLNFVATDYETRNNDNITTLQLTKSVVTVEQLATHYNVLTGKADLAATDEGNYTFSFTANDVIAEEFDSIDSDKTWIAMNYLLLPERENSFTVSATFNVTATYSTSQMLNHVVNFPATKVNAAANYRTNIVGELFTEGGSINIIVDPKFGTPDNGMAID